MQTDTGIDVKNLSDRRLWEILRLAETDEQRAATKIMASALRWWHQPKARRSRRWMFCSNAVSPARSMHGGCAAIVEVSWCFGEFLMTPASRSVRRAKAPRLGVLAAHAELVARVGDQCRRGALLGSALLLGARSLFAA